MTSTITDFECWRDADHEVQPHPTYFWPQCTVCGAAPAYHDRPRYIPDDFALNLYVPDGRTIIKEGSGIVGLETRPDVIETYYEGFIYQPGLVTDAARWRYAVLHAAGRQIVQYPTVARMFLSPNHLIQVGTFYPKTETYIVDNRGPLVAWINDQSL